MRRAPLALLLLSGCAGCGLQPGDFSPLLIDAAALGAIALCLFAAWRTARRPAAFAPEAARPRCPSCFATLDVPEVLHGGGCPIAGLPVLVAARPVVEDLSDRAVPPSPYRPLAGLWGFLPEWERPPARRARGAACPQVLLGLLAASLLLAGATGAGREGPNGSCSGGGGGAWCPNTTSAAPPALHHGGEGYRVRREPQEPPPLPGGGPDAGGVPPPSPPPSLGATLRRGLLSWQTWAAVFIVILAGLLYRTMARPVSEVLPGVPPPPPPPAPEPPASGPPPPPAGPGVRGRRRFCCARGLHLGNPAHLILPDPPVPEPVPHPVDSGRLGEPLLADTSQPEKERPHV